MIRSFTFLCFALLTAISFGQQEADSLQLKEDSDQQLHSRSFDGDLSSKYQGEEFNYDIKTGEPQNLIGRFLQWFFQTLRDNFGIDISPEAMKILEYVIYLLMGGLVIYLLVRFFIRENLSSIFSKGPSGTIDINLSEEHIERIDLNALLQEALKQKDYRLAVRYQYLKALKILSQQDIIDWHYEKTNWDYQREIKLPSIQSIFKEVSYIYDYIWYGEQHINEIGYKAAEARFVALKNQIP
ncbi:MAG: hypothetical protein AB3N14_15580 [Flavobacteriaceae bacterium]